MEVEGFFVALKSSLLLCSDVLDGQVGRVLDNVVRSKFAKTVVVLSLRNFFGLRAGFGLGCSAAVGG